MRPSERLAAELGVGYQFGVVDEVLFSPQVAIGLTSRIDLAVGALVNTAGDYTWTIGGSFHFGGTGLHPTIHNVAASGAGRFTPFPRRGPADVLRAREDRRPDPGSGILGATTAPGGRVVRQEPVTAGGDGDGDDDGSAGCGPGNPPGPDGNCSGGGDDTNPGGQGNDGGLGNPGGGK